MKLKRIVQDFSRQPTLSPENIPSAVTAGLERVLSDRKITKPGRCVLGLGSRGIPNYLTVCRATADFFRSRGWEVAAHAAMGTHGGDDAHAEIELLASRHGITAESLGGVTMLAGTEASQIGVTTRGVDVFLPKVVLEWASAAPQGSLVPVNRIKAHTHTTRSICSGMERPIGSGAFKMLSIGFGKGAGAREVHGKAATFWDPPTQKNTETLGDTLEEVGRFVIDQGHVLAGVGIVDNANHATAHVLGLDPDTYFQDEIPWLLKANEYLPDIPFVPDVLVVDSIGKNISGTGAAPQVIRRWPDGRACVSPTVLCMLRLHPESHGSAFGIGWADVTTTQLVSEIDVPFTEANTLGAGDPELGEPPALQAATSREAVERAVELAARRLRKPASELSVLLIKDTNSLEEFYYSGPATRIAELTARNNLAIDAQEHDLAAFGADLQALWN